jgi:sarcosine oxidase
VSTQVDVVVIGGGAMGSAAAWQIARRGKSVVLLEQFEAGHSVGASHGAARNFNTAYSEPDYVSLVTEARTLWDDLSEQTGTQLLDLVGLVNHGDPAPLKRVRETHATFGIDSGFLSPGEAEARWPGMRFRSDVLLVPGAGRVRSADSLTALRTAAEVSGAQFLYNSPVRALTVTGENSVVVTTDTNEFHAARVIVTAGAWSSKVLRSLVQLPPLVVTQEQPAHFQPLDPTLVWPSFNHTPDPSRREDDYFYSPVYGMLTPGEGIKAGWHGVGPIVDPDARTYIPEPVQFEALQRYAREWLPGVDADAHVAISCTYTSTESTDFILDRVGPIVVGAGFSGHGFKFTPAIGRILADLAEGIPASPRFALDRPTLAVATDPGMLQHGRQGQPNGTSAL